MRFERRFSSGPECCSDSRADGTVSGPGARFARVSRFVARRPRRLARPRTPAFHVGNTGSNPVGDATGNRARYLRLLPALEAQQAHDIGYRTFAVFGQKRVEFAIDSAERARPFLDQR